MRDLGSIRGLFVFSALLTFCILLVSAPLSGQTSATVGVLNTIRFADQFSSIQAAINDLPSAGGTVFIPAGTFDCGAPTNIVINKPVNLVGAGAGDAYGSLGAATILTNSTQSVPCITVQANAGFGAKIADFAIRGNSSVGGATALADNILLKGSTTTGGLWNIKIENVLSTFAKGSGVHITNTAFMVQIKDSFFQQNSGNGILVDGALGAGIPSQIGIYGTHIWNNGGDCILQAGAAQDLTMFGGSLANCQNGYHTAPGAINATARFFGVNFEQNNNAGALFEDGYGYEIADSQFLADDTSRYAVYANFPAGTSPDLIQLQMRNNILGRSIVKDVYIGPGAHHVIIWPQVYQRSSYSLSDASGKACVMDQNGPTMSTCGINVTSAWPETSVGLKVSNPTGGSQFSVIPNNAASELNALVEDHDVFLRGDTGSADEGGIVIGPQSSSSKGIRIDGPTGAVTVGANSTLTAANTTGVFVGGQLRNAKVYTNTIRLNGGVAMHTFSNNFSFSDSNYVCSANDISFPAVSSLEGKTTTSVIVKGLGTDYIDIICIGL
jgi:hypothetical protein